MGSSKPWFSWPGTYEFCKFDAYGPGSIDDGRHRPWGEQAHVDADLASGYAHGLVVVPNFGLPPLCHVLVFGPRTE